MALGGNGLLLFVHGEWDIGVLAQPSRPLIFLYILKSFILVVADERGRRPSIRIAATDILQICFHCRVRHWVALLLTFLFLFHCV